MYSVVIPHLNQAAELARCLASLAEQRGLTDPVEIIVVDNGSAARPVEVCAGFANVRLIDQPRPGPGLARNVGVEASHGDVLAFIDADCVADPDWLATIGRVMKASPPDTILGGNVLILCEDPGRLTVIEAYESVFAFRMKEYIEKKGFTGAGNLAVPRAVFDRVGPFGGIEIAEDTEWGRRATSLGFVIRYAENMTVYHPARKTFGQLAQKWDRQISHDFVDARSGRRGWWIKWLMRSAAVAASPAAEVGKVLYTDRLRGARSRLLAFAGLCRVRLYRSRVMLALAGGADAAALSGRWNRQ